MGDGVSHDESPAEPIVGKAPTARERALRAAADHLTPLQALASIDDASGRIVAAVSLVATLAGSVSLLTASSLSGVSIVWSIPCVVAAGLSVVAAVFGTLPSRARLAPGELEGLEAWFEEQITKRLLLIRTSAALLVVTVVAAVLPSVVSAIARRQTKVTVGLIATADGLVQLDASADGLPENATLQAVLTSGVTRLAFSRETPHSGQANIDLQVCTKPGSVVRAIVRPLDDGASTGRAISVTVPRASVVDRRRCRSNGEAPFVSPGHGGRRR
jgi:hypothetical protein